MKFGGCNNNLYDGEIIQEFRGNDNPRNTRVDLINEKVTVIFFHNSGFHIKALNELISSLKKK